MLWTGIHCDDMDVYISTSKLQILDRQWLSQGRSNTKDDAVPESGVFSFTGVLPGAMSGDGRRLSAEGPRSQGRAGTAERSVGRVSHRDDRNRPRSWFGFIRLFGSSWPPVRSSWWWNTARWLRSSTSLGWWRVFPSAPQSKPNASAYHARGFCQAGG